jgi:hypothetical protein
VRGGAEFWGAGPQGRWAGSSQKLCARLPGVALGRAGFQAACSAGRRLGFSFGDCRRLSFDMGCCVRSLK